MAASWNIFLYPKPRLPPQGQADQGQMGAGMRWGRRRGSWALIIAPLLTHAHHREPLPCHTKADTGTHHMPVTQPWAFWGTQEPQGPDFRKQSHHIHRYDHTLSTQHLTPSKSPWVLALFETGVGQKEALGGLNKRDRLHLRALPQNTNCPVPL